MCVHLSAGVAHQFYLPRHFLYIITLTHVPRVSHVHNLGIISESSRSQGHAKPLMKSMTWGVKRLSRKFAALLRVAKKESGIYDS